MKTIKALGYLLAAEIMSLFIGLTFAGSSSSGMRLISAVCTTGILVCLTINCAIHCASETLRSDRINGTETGKLQGAAIGGAMTLPLLISWVLLKISHASGGIDFYRWHKLLNAYFLQIYNLINADAETAALTASEVNLMLPLAFIPFIVFTVFYGLVCSGVIKETEK